jgi:hypothetical protein
MTIVAGSAVGVLGIEGWGGFAVYILSQLLVSNNASHLVSTCCGSCAGSCNSSWNDCMLTEPCGTEQRLGPVGCRASKAPHPLHVAPGVCRSTHSAFAYGQMQQPGTTP